MKFKPDDMVEIIGIPGKTDQYGVIGKIGTIITFYGDIKVPGSKIMYATWAVQIEDRILLIIEPALRLIPPKDDSRDVTSWDNCPWIKVPPRKKSVEA